MFSFLKNKIVGIFEYNQPDISPLTYELVEVLKKRYNDFEEEDISTDIFLEIRKFTDTKSGFVFYVEKFKELKGDLTRSIYTGGFSFNHRETKFILKTLKRLDKEVEKQKRRQREIEKEEKKEKEEKIRKSWIGKINI